MQGLFANGQNGNFKYFIGVETNGMPIPATYDVYEVNSQVMRYYPEANNEIFPKSETWRFIYAQWLPNSPMCLIPRALISNCMIKDATATKTKLSFTFR